MGANPIKIGDSGGTTTRGASPGVPLSPAGQREAAALGKALAARGGLTCVYLSSALRSRQTTNAIIKACPSTELETPTDDLQSWAIGEWEGGNATEIEPKLYKLAKYTPFLKPPGRSDAGYQGESFNDFRYSRLGYIAKQAAEWLNQRDLRLGIVTHSRVFKLVNAWIRGGMSPIFEINADVFGNGKEIGWPTSVFTLRPDGKATDPWKFEPFDLNGATGKLPGGVYMIRHASTNQNS